VRKPKFVDPFILACQTRHAKLAGIGVVCLQRLVASRALPSERLKDVLGGLKETTNLSRLWLPNAHRNTNHIKAWTSNSKFYSLYLLCFSITRTT
jgi:hypothetical protein